MKLLHLDIRGVLVNQVRRTHFKLDGCRTLSALAGCHRLVISFYAQLTLYKLEHCIESCG